jgi:co-chaperonin GroES (HSP10)
MLTPLKTQVIVRQIPQTLTTQSGIILSSDTSGNAEWVEIVSWGDQVHSDLESGQQAIIDWKHAREIKYLDNTYYVVPEQHILLVRE